MLGNAVGGHCNGIMEAMMKGRLRYTWRQKLSEFAYKPGGHCFVNSDTVPELDWTDTWRPCLAEVGDPGEWHC